VLAVHGPYQDRAGVGGVGRRRWYRLLAATVSCLIALELAGATGLVSAADENLRRLYYGIRGARQGPTDVVFVAIDEETVAAWGRPPWSSRQYLDLFEAIAAGSPRVIAVLEPGPRLLADQDARALRGSVSSVVVPPPAPGLQQPELVVDERGSVRAVRLRGVSGANVTAEAIAAAGLVAPGDGETMLVNFAGPPDTLPTVPAHRIATGEIPPSTFRDRIAIIGLRSERFAPQVPTPVGPMSPAEVHGHALLGLAHGVVWTSVPWWLPRLLWALLVMMGLVLVPRLGQLQAGLWLGTMVLGVAIADFTLFATGTALVGATGPASAAVLGLGTALVIERRLARTQMDALVRTVGTRLSLYAQERHAGDTDEEFLERFARASRSYIDFTSALFADLPPDSWRLKVRVYLDLHPGDIFERRRDVRREPFRQAYVSQRPTWSSRPFLNEDLEQRSLIVPLVALRRLLGVWIINVPKTSELTERDLEIIDGLAAQLSLALERRRLARLGVTAGRSAPADGRLVAEIGDARRLADALARDRQQLHDLVEWLPVGVLVANVWGEIELANEKMRRFVAVFGVAEPRRIDLVALLSRISGESSDNARDVLRQQLIDREPVDLVGTARGALGSETRYHIRLVPMAPSADEGRLPAGFVISVNEVRAGEMVEVEWEWQQNVAEDVARVDVRAILRRTIEELEVGTGDQQPLVLELPERAPRARVDPEALRDALDRIVAEIASERSGPPGWVRVGHDDRSVVIRIVDPAVTLPASQSSVVVDRARELLEPFGGDVEVDTDLERGTTVVIKVPRER